MDILGQENAGNNQFKLTLRERDVLELMRDGKTNSEIADKLFVSAHTTKAHIGNIFMKMGVHDRTEAVVQALKHKIIEFD